MRRVVAFVLATVAAVVLQTTVFPVFVPAWLAPNLLLVLVVYLGFHQFGPTGAAAAFLMGYILDTFSGTLLGLHALAFTVVYLGVQQVARVLWTESGVPAVLIVFVAGIVDAALVQLLASIVAGGGGAAWTTWATTMLQALAAAVVAPAVFRLVSGERRTVSVA